MAVWISLSVMPVPLFCLCAWKPNAVERIGAYINLAVSLTLAPLSEFLELLNRSDGCAVIISSFYVEHPVKEFPHYIAAKQAVEMLGQVASMQYRRVRTLIVRPEKLLTAMTNTPLGRLDAASPGADCQSYRHAPGRSTAGGDDRIHRLRNVLTIPTGE